MKSLALLNKMVLLLECVNSYFISELVCLKLAFVNLMHLDKSSNSDDGCNFFCRTVENSAFYACCIAQDW
jgi:hypothetical protein